MSEELRRKVEAAMDKLASSLPAEPERKPQPQPQREDWAPVRRLQSNARPNKMLSPHKTADTLLPEHKALIGKWATVDLPDNAGVARLRIYTVTVRRDGRVRAELRPPEGFTVYCTPDQLREVSDKP